MNFRYLLPILMIALAGCAAFPQSLVPLIAGYSLYTGLKENWHLTADEQTERSLVRRLAVTAADDLHSLKECLHKNNTFISGTVEGSYDVIDGYQQLRSIKADGSEGEKAIFNSCSRELLERDKKNIANGLLYTPRVLKRSFFFTFSSAVDPEIKGKVVSEKYRFTAEIPQF